MTSKVVQLQAASVVYPSDRVAEFIALAREIDALVPREVWESDVWSVGSSFMSKGQNRANRVLAFYNRDATLTSRQEIVGGAPLAGSFKEFAKAYIRYTHATAPVAFENTMKRLDALQLIEAAFREMQLAPCIEDLNVVTLNTAVAMASEGVGPGRHYQFASNIQQIYRFCMDRKYLNAPFQWKHGVRKPTEKTQGIDQESKKWREEKLPSPEAFHALADVYRHSETFVDRLYSAVSAIFVSIPIRVHEVLQLRVDCEVYDKVKHPETGEVTDAYGIRVFPGKGHPPQVKWVPTQMASIVKDAIGRIREMCTDARSVAAWYEAHPGQLWLPPELEHHRASGWLPKQSISELFKITHDYNILPFLKRLGVEWRPGTDGQLNDAHLASLAAAHLANLPHDFPYFNGNKEQRYSATLIVLFGNQCHARRGTYRTLVEQATVQSFDHWLSGHDGGKKPSVFERWGKTENDGSPIRITSHSFRHWLNTVAQLRGLGDMDIAKWSGREIEQNQAYNHVTDDEVLSQIRVALDDGKGIGPMFEAAKAIGLNRPVHSRDFAQAQIGSALITELGICVHDYSLLPCQSHGDCLGCSENVFIKGDMKHQERVRRRHELTEKQLESAIAAMGENFYGADKWVESHQKSLDKLREMLAIHDNPSIPDGTVINLKGGSRDNEVAMALRDRQALSNDNDLTEVAELDNADAALVEMWED